MKLLLCIFAITVSCQAQDDEMIPQCTCDQADECMMMAKESVEPCFDECKDTFSAIGDPDGIKGCMEGKAEKLAEMKDCIHEKIGKGCAEEEGQMIKKIDYEDIFLHQADKMKHKFEKMKANPLFANMSSVMKTVKDFGMCVKKCVFDKVDGCFRGKKCGIELPEKKVMVKAMRECYGKPPAGHMQKMCECMVEKGKVTMIENMCPLIKMMASRLQSRGAAMLKGVVDGSDEE